MARPSLESSPALKTLQTIAGNMGHGSRDLGVCLKNGDVKSALDYCRMFDGGSDKIRQAAQALKREIENAGFTASSLRPAPKVR